MTGPHRTNPGREGSLRGTASIVEIVHARRDEVYSCRWDPAAEANVPEEFRGSPGSKAPVERTDMADLEAAIDWGRGRAAVVIVRLTFGEQDAGRVFSAGMVDPVGWKGPRWPPSGVERALIEEEQRLIRECLSENGILTPDVLAAIERLRGSTTE